VGLIIAIMALVAYHFFRLKISALTLEMEETVEKLLNAWFLPSITLKDTTQGKKVKVKDGSYLSDKNLPDKKEASLPAKRLVKKNNSTPS
jgi:hypothetical protein